MTSYNLINPTLLGNIETEFTGDSPADAANACWNKIAKLMTGNNPEFYFTLQETSGDKLLHNFKVVETPVSPDSRINDYTIEEIPVELTEEQQKEFLKDLKSTKNKIENEAVQQNGGVRRQKGGKHKRGRRHRYDDDDDDSSDSDSDDDDAYLTALRLRSLHQPITHFLYTPTIYGVRRIFTPIFTQPLYPYIQLYFPKVFIPMR